MRRHANCSVCVLRARTFTLLMLLLLLLLLLLLPSSFILPSSFLPFFLTFRLYSPSPPFQQQASLARKADFDTVEQGLEDKLDKDESNNIVARLKESRREDLAQHERGQKAVEGTSSNLSVSGPIMLYPLYTLYTPL